MGIDGKILIAGTPPTGGPVVGMLGSELSTLEEPAETPFPPAVAALPTMLVIAFGMTMFRGLAGWPERG